VTAGSDGDAAIMFSFVCDTRKVLARLPGAASRRSAVSVPFALAEYRFVKTRSNCFVSFRGGCAPYVPAYHGNSRASIPTGFV
jgi:hypothetical protein